MNDLIGKFVYFDYVDDSNYNFGQIVEITDIGVNIHQIKQVYEGKEYSTDRIRGRNLDYDLEHNTIKFVEMDNNKLAEITMGMSKCVINPRMISKTPYMEHLDQFINYYLADYFVIDIVAMKWYKNIQHMIKINDFNSNLLITDDELMYLNQLNYIDLYLIDKTLKVIVVSNKFVQAPGTIFEFEIDGYFLDDIRLDYKISDDGKLLSKCFIKLEQ